MGWDEVITGWTEALDDIDHALAVGDWIRLEGVRWPEPEHGLAEPTEEQKSDVADLSRRQLAAIVAVETMLDDVGRELLDAAKHRGAIKAYGASGGAVTGKAGA